MDFSIAPYYDDFDSTSGAKLNNYMRILFKPGYAVQARELTQLQSILQNQIKSLGDFVFQNGSPVHGGHLTFTNTGRAIQLQPTQDGIPITISDFSDQLIINYEGSATVRAKVVAVDDSLQGESSAGALIIKYLTGSEFTDGDVIQIAAGTESTATLLSVNAISNCSTVSINDGIFYVDGFFVYLSSQTIVLDSQSTAPSYKIGLQVEDSLINYSEDSNLLDPAQGSFNYQAPGADRYQFNLALTKRSIDSTDTSRFFELLRIEDGVITKQVQYPMLGDLEGTLARRTYDQSGDFTVKPFKISLKDNPANTETYLIKLDPGKAYVKGYEFETIGTVSLENDKARTQDRSEYHDMTMEFGNFMITSNLYSGNTGFFDTANFELVDLHIVPTANINNRSSYAYANTKIGTARIRDINASGTGNYYTYLLDVNTSPVIFNALAFTPDLTKANVGFLSPYPNAYANVQLKIISGNSAGEIRSILSYDSTTGLATVDSPFPQQIDTNSLISLAFAVKDVKSIVKGPASYIAANVYAGQNSTATVYPCMDISPNGKEPSSGNTRLYYTEYNKLIYPLPHAYIAQSQVGAPSMNNVSYMTKKVYRNIQFSVALGSPRANAIIGGGGSNNLTGDEQFTYGYPNAFIPDGIVNSDIIVTVRDKLSSNLTNGSVIVFNQASVVNGNGVYQTDETAITIAVSSTSAFYGDVMVRVSEPSAETSTRRTKTRFGGTRNTLIDTDSYTVGTSVVQGLANANTWINPDNGIVWYTNINDTARRPGAAQSLYLPDVTALIAVYDSGDPNYAPNVSNAIDVTNRYIFKDGQSDNYYDHSYLLLREGYSPPRGQTAAIITGYHHSTHSGFFNADSYSSTEYQNGYVPIYSSRNFGTLRLSDSIDFRPTRANGIYAAANAFNILAITADHGLRMGHPDYAMTLSYGYYLPRIDKVTLTRDKQFKILKGTPAAFPKAPADIDDAMTLYVIAMPAYTANVAKITTKYIENRGYTMRDIGTLDKRIQQVEYYTTLNALQSRAKDQTVFYQNGSVAKDVYGIVTDNFYDYSIADNSTNTDTFANIGEGTLEAYKVYNTYGLNFYSSTGAHSKNGKTYTVDYSETPAVTQNTVTRGIVVQPFSFGEFRGELKLTPETDYWFSDSIPPVIIGPPRQQAPILPPPSIGVSAYPTTPGGGGTTPSGPVVVVSGALPDATVGTSYDQTFAAAGSANTPYVWTISNGSLPPGLGLSVTGTSSAHISGTPTTPIVSGFTIKATDSQGYDGTSDYTLKVVQAAPTITLLPTTLYAEKAYSVANTTAIVASGGTSPYTYSITSGILPTGMSLSSGGSLSGTPTQTGHFSFTVTANDSLSYTGTQGFTLDVAAPTLSMTPSTLAVANGGVAYSQTVTASGGTSPYTYQIVTGSGSLPTGLTLNPTSGIINGTTSVSAGAYGITIRATDTHNYTVDKAYTLSVDAPKITVSGTFAAAVQNKSYSVTLSSSGGTASYTYSIISGGTGLPVGLSLSSSGVISGKSTTSGTYTFTVRSTDSIGYTGSATFSLTVTAQVITPPTITLSASFPAGTVSSPYNTSNTVTASGGTAPYTYTLIGSGTLPLGLSLSSAGVISGTPTTAGNWSFTIQAADASTYTGTQSYSINIGTATIGITPTTLSTASVGVAYSQTLTCTGTSLSGANTFTLRGSSALPSSLSLSSAGVISGTPAGFAAGAYDIVIRVTNAGTGLYADRPYRLTVSPPSLIVTPATAASGTAGSPYSVTYSTTGGSGTYTYSIANGSPLPAGLKLSGATLSGTPTEAGTFTYIVNSTDSNGALGAVTHTLVIAAPVVNLSSTSTLTAQSGTSYTGKIVASGGTSPYSGFTITSSTGLPPGISLSNDGSISGSVSGSASSYPFTVTATDNYGFTGTSNFTFTVTAAPAVAQQGVLIYGVTSDGTSFSYCDTWEQAALYITAAGASPQMFSWISEGGPCDLYATTASGTGSTNPMTTASSSSTGGTTTTVPVETTTSTTTVTAGSGSTSTTDPNAGLIYYNGAYVTRAEYDAIMNDLYLTGMGSYGYNMW